MSPRRRKPAWESYVRAFAEELFDQLIDQAVSGAAPEPPGPRPRRATCRGSDDDAYTALGLLPGAPLDVCEAVYRARVKRAHPDAGGDPGEFRRLAEAIERIRRRR